MTLRLDGKVHAIYFMLVLFNDRFRLHLKTLCGDLCLIVLEF
jgi:hypothetical protein